MESVSNNKLFAMAKHELDILTRPLLKVEHDNTVMADEYFLPLPPSMAAKSRFPPGCTVLVETIDLSSKAALCIPRFIRGSVTEVGINLSQGSSRETLFKIERQQTMGVTSPKPMYVREEALQFALGCSVWFLPLGVTGTREKAMAVGSQRQPLMEDLCLAALALCPDIYYSVQMSSGIVCHGIQPDQLIYRSLVIRANNTAKKEYIKGEESAHNSPISVDATTAVDMTNTKDMLIKQRVAPPTPPVNVDLACIQKQDVVMIVSQTTDSNEATMPTQDELCYTPVSQPPAWSEEFRSSTESQRSAQVTPTKECFSGDLSFSDRQKHSKAETHVLAVHTGPNRSSETKNAPPLRPQRGYLLQDLGRHQSSKFEHSKEGEKPIRKVHFQLKNTSVWASCDLRGCESPKKRRKTHCDGSNHSLSSRLNSTQSGTFHLPIEFGRQFLLDVTLRQSGRVSEGIRETCPCAITAEGKLLTNTTLVEAGRTASCAESLRDYQVALEHRLFTAVRPILRGYLLVKLGEMNTYRPKHQGIIQSRNPYSDGHDPTDLHYMNLFETGSYPLSMSSAPCLEWKTTLEKDYPSCRIKLIYEHECHPCESKFSSNKNTKHQRMMRPHIFLSGPSYEDVYECRLVLESYIETSRRIRVAEHNTF